MPLDQQTKAIIKQIDDVLAKSHLAGNSAEGQSKTVNTLLSAIQRLSPRGSVYVANAKGYEKYLTMTNAIGLPNQIGLAIGPLRGILQAIRSEYEDGYFQSLIELLHGDIFSDFLEMANHLLEQGYKDPAAVVIGSVLESHLRKLCDKNHVPVLKADGTSKKAESLNVELTAANVYNLLDQKSVTAWLDLRNKAAHGKYGEYTKEQVALMLENVRNFISRIPA